MSNTAMMMGLGSGGAPSPYGYFGDEYDGWNGSRILIDSTTLESNSTVNSTWVSLSGHISHNLQGFFGFYDGPHYYLWPNAGSTYSTAGAYYVTTTKTTFSPTSAATNGADRGTTIAYLSDADRSCVLIGGKSNNGTLSVYPRDTSSAVKFGTGAVYAGTVPSPYHASDIFVAWDGFNLLVTGQAKTTFSSFAIPTTLSGFTTLPAPNVTWTLNSGTTSGGYGIAYLGMDDAGNRYVADSQALTMYIYRLNATTGTTGTADRISEDSVSQTYGGYSIAADYKNRKLLVGAHNNGGRWSVFGE
jgi:hypothetical protein